MRLSLLQKKMKRTTQKEMENLLESYKAYRGTQKDFCKEHGIKAHTLHYWRNKLSNAESDNKGNKFLPIAIKDYSLSSQAPSSTQIEIGYSNGNTIRLSATTSITLIHQLLQIRC